MNLGGLSHVHRLHIYVGEGHIKDEHVTFELEDGENYLAQMTPVSDHFQNLNKNISSGYFPEAGKYHYSRSERKKREVK